MVLNHLLKKGLIPGYYTWTEHGETSIREVGQTSVAIDYDDDDDAYDCRRVLFDSINGYNPTIQPYQPSNTIEEDVPNPKAKSFYDMLQASDEPLWEGCPNWTTLQAATALLNWKSHCNVLVSAFNFILPIFKSMLPKYNLLPDNLYVIKKSLDRLSMPSQKIHACINHCMLFYDDADKELTHYRWCNEPHYKSDRQKIPQLVLTYMKIVPRLQKLYMNKKTAKDMTWHNDHKTNEGIMAHPSDRKLSLVILGRKSPGQNLDVFLRPLIDKFVIVYESILKFDQWIREEEPFIKDEDLVNRREALFAQWFNNNVMLESNGDNAHLKCLAQYPLTNVYYCKGYLHENDYYGLLDEIIEVKYDSILGRCVVVVFKCTWFDPVQWVRVDHENGLVEIKHTKRGCTDNPYILASQAKQVYYTPYPYVKDLWAVIKTNSRGVYDIDEDISVVAADENNVDRDQFFQENERVIFEEHEFEDIASDENDDAELIYEEDESDKLSGPRPSHSMANSGQMRLEDHLTDDDGIEGIEIDEFADQITIGRAITEIIHFRYIEPWSAWGAVPQDKKDQMWLRFKQLHQWDPKKDELIRKCFIKHAAN
nr:hypothetical protein [Tanacetum cinerariifolium]